MHTQSTEREREKEREREIDFETFGDKACQKKLKNL
jgi:hypothetical protein